MRVGATEKPAPTLAEEKHQVKVDIDPTRQGKYEVNIKDIGWTLEPKKSLPSY